MVSVKDPHGRNLDFLDRSRYFFFQVAPQLLFESSTFMHPLQRGTWLLCLKLHAILTCVDVTTHTPGSRDEIRTEIYNKKRTHLCDRFYVCTYLSMFLVLTPYIGLFVLTQIFQYNSCHLQMERGILYHTNINDKMLWSQNNHLS
jgi:hypothetical protein